MPRILFLDHSGALGGAELYLLDVARHYRETATVAVFEEGPFAERLRADNIDTEVLQDEASKLQSVRKTSRLGDTLAAVPSVIRLVAKTVHHARQHDLIFANSQKALIVGALAGWLTGRPVIWNLHDMLTADHFSHVNRRIAVSCANWLVDRVIVNSEATRQAFAESGGDVEKTGLVYNGIPAAPFEAITDDDVAALRANFALPDKPLIGVFSRLAPWKGQHVLIEALLDVPGAHALLVGDALFTGDTDYATRLREQAHRLGVDDRVHFLGFRDDIPALMYLVDIVAHTSTAAEPFGRVIVEGMLSGCPVVATRAGGPREIIDDGETGRLVPPEDPAALARTLRTMLDAPETMSRLAQRGHQCARDRFSVERMLEALASNIQDTLEARR